MATCKDLSNWVTPLDNQLSPGSIHKSSWNVIHTIQEALRNVNNINDCLSLSYARRDLIDEDLDLGYLFKIVYFLKSQLPCNHKQIWLQIIHARLMLARGNV